MKLTQTKNRHQFMEYRVSMSLRAKRGNPKTMNYEPQSTNNSLYPIPYSLMHDKRYTVLFKIEGRNCAYAKFQHLLSIINC